jgi:MoaA/NifB/PqqE/SkfB family radical SAM enzyme
MNHQSEERILFSIYQRVRKWLGGSPQRWDWLQVEVSSQCHAACIYCPTAIYRKEGSNLLMSMECFQKLSPAFSRARLVYLQGWGEPFLNPHFFEMARMAKAAGSQMGTTTNGMLLDADKLTEMVRSGVDVVAFSLAGCTETNDVFRKGTRLARVLETIRQLNVVKEKEKAAYPDIHIAYMLLRSGLDEIEQLPGLLAGLGISQVVISTLDFVPSPALERETLIPSGQEEYASLRARLDGLAAVGNKSGLDIHYQIIAPHEALVENSLSTPSELDFTAFLPVTPSACTENIQRSVFISAGGNVSPCVFTHLPVRSPEVVGSQIGRPYLPLIFGNVRDQSLEVIWQSKAYRAFRRSHRVGRLKGPCQHCLKPKVRGF